VQNLSFLIIDENAHELCMFKVLLRAFGVRQIEECYESAHAWDAFQASAPEIVIVSDKLISVRAFEIVRRLRNFENSPDPYVPIIFASAHADGLRLRQTRAAGVNEIVRRPVTVTELYGAIDAIVNQPRPFIRVPGYFGPCRRREASFYSRSERRRADVSRAVGGMTPFNPFPHALALARSGRPSIIAAE